MPYKPLLIPTPWAILLCKFKGDNSTPPHPRKFYEDLFTSVGVGTQGMVDFFRDMSHGRLDLSGSQIFPPEGWGDGWLTLLHSKEEYDKIVTVRQLYDVTRKGVEPPDPNYVFRTWAEEAATLYHPDVPRVDLTKFSGVVAVANVGSVGLVGWIGDMRAICDEFSVKPSLLGQEMGHGYGLYHSRLHDSEVDYQDPYDIMSTRGAYMARHPAYDSIGWPLIRDYGKSIGPGLNAANMVSRGWLDYSRVKKITYGAAETVDLRPLHRLDLPGSLAISVDKYFIEFRMNEGWDAAFPTPVVLIHFFEENHSYLMEPILTKKGDKFEIKEGEHTAFYYHLKIELLDIDVGKRSARISIDYSPLSIPPEIRYKWPWEYISPAIPSTHLGPGEDIVIVYEKMIRTPQWSLRPILKALADISSSERFDNEDIRRRALETIIKIADEELRLDTQTGVAPPRDLGGQSQQST